MSHKKIEPNIYHDERCTKQPYYVSIMRRGHSFYKKFDNVKDAQEAKKKFIEFHDTIETEHPYVFIRNNAYVVEIMIQKEYDDFETACAKANILQKFAE